MSGTGTDHVLEPVVAAVVTEPAAAPIAAPAVDPVAAAPVVADAPVAVPEAPAQPEGAAPDAPAAEGPKPEDKPAEAAPEVKPSLLAEAGKPEAKPEEAKPADGATAAETITEAAPLTYDTLTLPEGLTAAPEQMKGYTDLLTKHGVSPEVGQELLSMYGEQVKAFTEQASKNQWDAWNATREGWRNEVMADDRIGGAGHQTAMQAIARARDAFASHHKLGTPGYAADVAELTTALNLTGVGDHPALLRFFHNVARHFDEPAAPGGITPKPTKTNGQPPGQRGPKAIYDQTRAN